MITGLFSLVGFLTSCFGFLLVVIFILLIVLYRRPSKRQIHALRYLLPTNAERPLQLHPDELERLAVYVYQRLGYRRVKHTGLHSSTDGGVDVWLLNQRGEVEIVQCKQWRARVSKGQLIEFANVMRQQHAEAGYYWAPGGFTKPAIEYAERNGISIYADYGIRKILEKITVIDAEVKAAVSVPVAQPKETRAGWTMAQNTIIFGMFLLACALIYFVIIAISQGG